MAILGLMVFLIVGTGNLLVVAAGWSVFQVLADPRFIPTVILYVVRESCSSAPSSAQSPKRWGLAKADETLLQLAPYRKPLIAMVLAFLILIAATAIALMMFGETPLFEYLQVPFARS